jgi:hypothetical protein
MLASVSKDPQPIPTATLCSHAVSKRIALLLASLSAFLTAGCASATPAAQTVIQHPSATVSPTTSATVLPCHAAATRKHPADYSTVGVRVRTVARARVSAKESGRRATHQEGRAAKNGKLTLRFAVGTGPRVRVEVHVSRHGRTGDCSASFRPAATPTVTPSPTVPVSSPTSSAPKPKPTASCYPVSDEGTCYEPGEYCRDDDHGATGLAGDGEQIICEDNDGWRWEPVS